MAAWMILGLLCIISHAAQPVAAGVDATLQPKANGIDVVRATVRKIRSSCIFPNDYGFMLRVALVESNFGLHPKTFRPDTASGGKGIWQMDRIGFDDTMLVSSAVLNSVKNKLGVNWFNMTYASDNMNVPLYNALAARLLLWRKPAAIPPDLEAQARYWKTYYNTAAGSGKESDFISKVKSMPACATAGADLLFILDASGSIGYHDFELMKQVVVAVARSFTIERNATQIAVLTFDDYIQESINFGNYSSVEPLAAAIAALKFTSGGTNTHLALNMVPAMFQSARPLDSGFARVVIVLTDGGSNQPDETRMAAERLNAYSWLERYAVGMGSGINEAELHLIAPICSHVYTISSVSAISALTDELYDLTCQSSVALPPPTGNYSKLTGTLSPNTPRNVRDTAASRVTGRTYALQVTSGSATLYVSFTAENPNSALNDYLATAHRNRPGLVFVSSTEMASAGGALDRRRRDLSSNSSTNSNATNRVLYLSIVPNADSESVSFQLDALDGDRRKQYPNSAVRSSMNFLLLGITGILVLTSVTG